MTSAALPNDDSKKTKARLVSELRKLRTRIGNLEKSQGLTKAALSESKRRIFESATLLESAQAILENEDYRKAVGTVFAICKKAIGATAGEVSVFGNDKGATEAVFTDVESDKINAGFSLLAQDAYQKVCRHGQTVRIHNFLHSDWSKFSPAAYTNLENLLLAPMHFDGETVGVLGLANKAGGFTEKDVSLALSFARQMAACFRNGRRLQELRSSESNYRRLAEQLRAEMNEKAARMRQTETLAEMGQMISTVAHEIRNVLHVIQMGAQAMRAEIGDDLKKAEILQEIDYGVDLLNEIGRELLDYSKPLKLECSTCDINKLIENALATASIKCQFVNLIFNLSDRSINVYVDEAKIIRVLLNVISNAIDAMPYGGKLTISSAVYDADKLLLTVKDTGCGIHEDDLERVQQPFVTTKENGTGLGISVCRKIIDAHGGTFRMSSKLNEGTTVEIELPLTKQVHQTPGKRKKEKAEEKE